MHQNCVRAEVGCRSGVNLQRLIDNDRTRRQLGRALKAVEAALLEEGFVSARNPELLGADMALAAILLVKGLADGLLDPQDYRETTRRLWTALFFGEQGRPGRLSARLAMLADAEKEAFIAAITSPRLSAALTLWSMTDWAAIDADASAFRLATARLYQTHRWLFANGPVDAILAEIASQAEVLLPPNEQALASRAWVELVRVGEALEALIFGHEGSLGLEALRPCEGRLARTFRCGLGGR